MKFAKWGKEEREKRAIRGDLNICGGSAKLSYLKEPSLNREI